MSSRLHKKFTFYDYQISFHLTTCYTSVSIISISVFTTSQPLKITFEAVNQSYQHSTISLTQHGLFVVLWVDTIAMCLYLGWENFFCKHLTILVLSVNLRLLYPDFQQKIHVSN